ncbi:MAG: FHA domain-containing protein [Candidatus Nanopelagicales bacterium]
MASYWSDVDIAKLVSDDLSGAAVRAKFSLCSVPSSRGRRAMDMGCRVKLRLTCCCAGEPVDLEVTLDGAATVGDLAAALVAQDPLRPYDPAFSGDVLAIVGTWTDCLLPEQAVGDSKLASGDVVGVVAATAPARARLPRWRRCTSWRGPTRVSVFALHAGTNYIGRGLDMDVRLSDLLVSKSHAKVNVGDGVEIIDNNSSNGVVVGGGRQAALRVGA